MVTGRNKNPSNVHGTGGSFMTARTFIVALICIAAASGCASESAVLVNASGQSVTCQNEGWGWIGAPVAMANQSDCIKKANAAGYQQTGPLAGGTPAAPALKASSLSGKLDLAFPAGWQTKPLTDPQRRVGMAIQASNITSDSTVIVAAVDAAGITDRNVYILSRRADQESRLKDASHSDITDIMVNGRPAKQFEVTGTAPDGVRRTFLYTAIFGQAEVVIVNAWTTAVNFNDQRPALQGLAERVSGIQ
jgi:hypothetical protein